MGKTLTLALSVALALALSAVTRAQDNVDLYAARVPVADQGQKALAAAARDALAEVLVKVSGSPGVLDNSVIAASLREAGTLVQQYSYSNGSGPGGGLTVRCEFDQAFITDLITRAGVPLWTANRPSVLAWVVIEDGSGRHFLNPELAPEQAEALREAFARRGVPLRLPLYDLADTANLTPDDAWRLDEAGLRAASARYQVEHIAAARLALAEDGRYLGDWSYIGPDGRADRAATAQDLDSYLQQGAGLVAEALAGRYAIAPGAVTDGGLRIAVRGVTAYADYVGIVSWLEGLELVDRATVEHVAGDLLELRLEARADAVQLAPLIELNNQLQPAPAAGTAALHYQWLK